MLALDARQPGLGVALPSAFGVGAGFDGGQRSGQPFDLGVGGLARVLSLQQGAFQFGAALGSGGDLGLQLFQLAVQPFQFASGVGGHAVLARAVGLDAGDLGLQPVDLGAGGLFGHVQPVALDDGAVQQGGGDRVFFTRRLQPFLRVQGRRLGRRRRRGGLGHQPVGLAQFGRRRLGRRLGVGPADVEQGRLKRADLGRNLLVLLRLTRLALQPVQRRLQLLADVVQPVEVGLGRPQAQLSLMASSMQARHAPGLFKDTAAVLRLGGDQFADLALAHQGRAVGAGRGVGEQQLNVPRPHLLAVDAIGRAAPALDPARDFQHGAVGKGLGRALLSVVDGQLDFGVVARRTARSAREDHVLHALAAHGLGRVGAHDPAQAFQHVRLAAAVRPDDAGQPGLDLHLGRVDEGFEADEPEALELHRVSISAPGSAGRWPPTGPPANGR